MNSQAAVLLARRFSTAAQVVYSIDFTKDMSSEPMIAETSANMWPRLRKPNVR